MPSYKLEYFDGRARGELTRYAFHAAGQDYEDVRYTFEEWASIKPKTPFGQIPLLHVDGKKLAQSGSIARFLARELGLAGKTSWDQAIIDQYMELAADMFKEVAKWFFEKDEANKAELTKNLNEVVYPKYCGIFQNALEQNGGKYLVGDKLSLADLVALDMFDTPMQHNPKMMDSFGKLKAYRQNIASLPNLAKYIAKRKVTDI